MAGGMDEALKAFIVESTEALTRLEEDLVNLERAPADATLIARVFRTVHTIKGTCGFFAFNRLESITHVAEDALAQLREGRIAFSRNLVGALFELIDATRQILANIEQTGGEGVGNHTGLIEAFEHIRNGVAEVETGEAAAAAMPEQERSAGVSDTSVRVDVQLLDMLINVVGELVLARNQILQSAETLGDPILQTVSQRLNVITGELQEGMMKTRMQPISSAWGGLPRLIRDLEVHTGKKVKLVREGGDTELDRSLLQAIKDPLTHLVRNAVDHGMERPPQRLHAGKPETGVILLRAYHESGYVIIEISDDGAGVNLQAVVDRAIERGMVAADQAARLAERDILEFLFRPGFSTAPAVTSISGRGVGLDVVCNNVERVGGSVDIHTFPGQGTAFKLRIPLTLAIVPALIATCHDERYAIPQVNLLEVVRLDAEEWPHRIEAVHSSRVYRLRGRLLPLVELRGLLALPARPRDAALHILVLQADDREFGLVVDAVRDTEEIVVKPLGRHLKGVTCFAGATIMGDGRIALILDTAAIAQRARLLGDSTSASRLGSRRAGDEASGQSSSLQAMLLFQVGSSGLGAIPLSRVQRLEEISHGAVEYSCGQPVVQYRGQILPLIHLTRMLGGENAADGTDEEAVQVIVHPASDGLVGVVVDHIIDVVEENMQTVPRPGADRVITGSAVIQGRVADLIDLDQVVARSRILLQRSPTPSPAEHGDGQ